MKNNEQTPSGALLFKIGAAYVRVSDERQDEYSPASQLKKIREYAAKDGYDIPDEYVFYDDGISGRSVKGRDEFKRMISVATSKEHPFDTLYVWKLSRFSRSMEDSIIYKSMLQKKGVRVVSVSEPISDDIYGKLMERFLEWDAQFYSERLSEEVKRGISEKLARGEPTTPPPIGYVMREGKYYPDTETGRADVAHNMFRRYANGDKMRAIAVWLIQIGIRTRHGNLPDVRFVKYVLRNPCYIGKLRVRKSDAKGLKNRRVGPDAYIIIDGIHDPLVSLELWDTVQSMLDEEERRYLKHARKEQSVEYMLKGLLRCSSCGGGIAMASAKSGKGKISTVQCCNYSRGTCHESHASTMPKLESALFAGLHKALKDQDFKILPKESTNTEVEDRPDYDKLILIEKRRLERAREAYLNEVDSLEQYKGNKESIEKKIADLKALQSAERTPAAVDFDALSQKVVDVIDFISNEKATPQAKNEALRTIINKIVYEKASESLAIYFRAE